jgi:NAD(P)-dependent dehydrogenase (short-subunit alcohol dehydrogenase family)
MENQILKDLEGKVCVITGGGGVLGSSMADGLASAGVVTVILDIEEAAAHRVAAQISADHGVASFGYKADVLDKNSLERVEKRILSEAGDIELLINGAGGNSPRATTKLEELTESDLGRLDEGFFGLELEGFQQVFDLNFTGTLLPHAGVHPGHGPAAEREQYLNMSSHELPYKPLTKVPAYSAAKASVNSFTEWLAVHFGKVGVRVNALAPGFFPDPAEPLPADRRKDRGADSEGGDQDHCNNTPMGVFGEPGDLSGTVLFLLSDLSRFHYGHLHPGGWRLQRIWGSVG